MSAETVALDAGLDFSANETALYRLYDALGALLYVGITGNLQSRMSDHQKRSWWPSVASRAVTLYASRSEAAAAELAAIQDEHPLHNVTGTPRPAVVEVPKWKQLERKDCLLWPRQLDDLTALQRQLKSARCGSRGERITENTLVRVAIDLLMANAGQLQGSTEDELRQSLGLPS